MEEFSVKVEPSSNSQQTPVDEDLFHDMTPVFQKPKKVSENFTHMLITAHIEGLISNNIIRQYNCKFPCSKCNKSSDSKLGWGGGVGGERGWAGGLGSNANPSTFSIFHIQFLPLLQWPWIFGPFCYCKVLQLLH